MLATRGTTRIPEALPSLAHNGYDVDSMDDTRPYKPGSTAVDGEDNLIHEVGSPPRRTPGHPGTVITRAEASKLLGIDKSTFRRRERLGQYRSIGDDENGVKLYDRDAVVGPDATNVQASSEADASIASPPARTASPPAPIAGNTIASREDVQRVFVELAKDEDLVRIVLETGLPPTTVLDLHTSWTTLKRRSGGYHISRQSLDQLDRLELDGFPARSEKELVAAIVAIRDGLKNCERCRRAPRKPPQLCGSCEQEVNEIERAAFERKTTMRLRGELGTPARTAAAKNAAAASKRA